MHSKPVFLVIGLIAAAAILGGLLFIGRGSHIQLKGQFQKVRLQSLEDTSTVVIVDFRFSNPADYPFVVRKVDMMIETKDGQNVEGMMVSEVDARRMFDFYTVLGPKYNESFLIREKVAPHQSLDRMLAARFELPITSVNQRKKLWIRIEDVDGAVSELEEKP